MKRITLSFVASLLVMLAFGQTNWTLSNSGIPIGYSPNDFAVAPNGDIYLVSSQWNGSSFTPRLLKSANDGNTWSEVTMNGLTNVQNTNSIIFSSNKLLLAGSNSITTSYFVYASTDNGANWTLSNTGIPVGYSPNDFAIAPNADIYLVASQYSGTAFIPKLLKSIDGGSSWVEVTMNGLNNIQNTNSIIFVGNKLLLAGSNSSTSSYYVYASTDNGVNWTLSNSGVPSGYSPNDFTLTSNQEIYLASSQWNGSAFSPKLLKSNDNGSSWTEITDLIGLTNLQNTNCIVFNNNKLLLGGSNSSTASYYVFKSDLPETSGLAEQHIETDFSFYPNPFQENIIVDNLSKSSVAYTITDNLGQIVLTGVINSNKQLINTAHLKPGLYLIIIDHGKLTRKLIKR